MKIRIKLLPTFDSLQYLFQVFILVVAVFSSSITPILQSNPVSAAPGDGHMLLFWDGGSVPTGWTCVSCTGGDDFYQRFPRGNDTYGGTGGGSTHTHTASGSADVTTDVMPARSNAGTGIVNNSHTHTFSPTIGTASNLPNYRQLQVIRHNTSGDPTTLPAGAIAMFDTTVPTGWTRYSAQDGAYIYAENTVGTTGGSNTHTHAITGSLGSSSGGARTSNLTNTQTGVATDNHVHTATGTSLSASNEPPYVETILGKLDADAGPVNGMYAMWDDDPTTDWDLKSDNGDTYYQNFMKPSASYGTTGGSSTNTHGDTSYLSGIPSATATSRVGGTVNASDDNHTHNVDVTNFSTDSHLPPYIDVIIAKLAPPSDLEQSAYRWFGNLDSTDVGSPLASLNTLATTPRQGKPFRLRFTIHITVANLDINGPNLKLQIAQRSSTCDTGFSGETYSDVSTSSGAIRYYNNTTPSDNTALTGNGNDPSHSGHTIVEQTYEESNDFTNSQSSIAIGEDGMWDASLVDFSASASTSYCFRVVYATGTILESYSVIPEITTDDGLGHMLLYWDGGAAPTGWTCVSCTSGDEFYQKFARGEATYGTTGGNATHTHTATGTSDAGALSGRSGAGTGLIDSHTHTSTPTIDPASNLPVYRQLQVIRANSSGTPGTIPAGAITIFDAAVPTGWTRYSTQDGSYVRGENTVGSTGGSNTHVNAITGTTDVGSGTASAPNVNPTQGPSASTAHTHTYSGNSDSQNNEPPFIETVLGKINADGSVPTNMLSMWDGPIPGAWAIQSDSGNPFYQRFIKPTATYGTTGGTATHSHGNVNFTSSGPSATTNTRTGLATVSSDVHTHTITISSFSTDNHLPPYVNVIIAKITGSNTAPDNPTALDQVEISTSGSIAVGGWSDGTSVRFEADATDSDNPDDLSLCVEVQELGDSFTNVENSCGSSSIFSGSAINITLTLNSLANSSEYHWQARVKDGFGAYSAWVSFGGNAESARDFAIDDTNPAGSVYDGTTIGVDTEYNDGSLSSLSANWDITDGDSGINLFEYAIGTTSGGTDVVNWTADGLSTDQTVGSLTLETSQIYFFSIRATDVAGNQSIITADGQLVAPTLSFSISGGGVSFDNLNSSNSYTDTKTTTVTTSTNAKNGYLVRLRATSLLETAIGGTINMFNGGTYASPDEWLGGDRGFGYTSDDSQIQGVNKFNPITCAGGGSNPCFAPFSLAIPGDIVADNENIIAGTPITNEEFIITHRVTTDSSYSAGNYQTLLIFNATAIY